MTEYLKDSFPLARPSGCNIKFAHKKSHNLTQIDKNVHAHSCSQGPNTLNEAHDLTFSAFRTPGQQAVLLLLFTFLVVCK